MLGIDRFTYKNNKSNYNPLLEIVQDNEAKDKYLDHCKKIEAEKSEQEAKVRQASKLYEKAENISVNSIAYSYLKETRQINYKIDNDNIHDSNIKTLEIWNKEANKKLPTIIAFARNKDGKITGGQQIFIDPATKAKADLTIAKKSFGKIAESFVELTNGNHSNNKTYNNNNNSNKLENSITIIAEGLETALSIKHAIDANSTDNTDNRDNAKNVKILCSLGISNIKNYEPENGEKIIIGADNDGALSITNKTIENAKETLSQKAKAMVIIVKPKELGDFNDYLQKFGSEQGEKEIRELFEPVINKLNLYDQKEAEIIADYENLFKDSRKVEATDVDKYLADNKELITNIISFKPSYNLMKLKAKLHNLSNITRDQLLKKEQYNEFKPYVRKIEEDFVKEKANAKSIDELLNIYKEEKELSIKLGKNHFSLLCDMDHDNKMQNQSKKIIKNQNTIINTYLTHEKRSDLIKNFERDIIYANKNDLTTEQRLFEDLQANKDLYMVTNKLFDKCQEHNIRSVKDDLQNIDSKGFIEKEGKKFDNSKNYLENIIHDKEFRPYISDFAEKKLFEMNKEASKIKLVQYKQQKQQQMEQEHKAQELEKIHTINLKIH